MLPCRLGSFSPAARPGEGLLIINQNKDLILCLRGFTLIVSMRGLPGRRCGWGGAPRVCVSGVELCVTK